MTNYILFEVDDIEVSKSNNGFSISFKHEHNRASVYINKDQLEKLKFLIETELQDSELVKEGVGKWYINLELGIKKRKKWLITQ